MHLTPGSGVGGGIKQGGIAHPLWGVSELHSSGGSVEY